jgi:hypothetical protein
MLPRTLALALALTFGLSGLAEAKTHKTVVRKTSVKAPKIKRYKVKKAKHQKVRRTSR